MSIYLDQFRHVIANAEWAEGRKIMQQPAVVKASFWGKQPVIPTASLKSFVFVLKALKQSRVNTLAS